MNALVPVADLKRLLGIPEEDTASDDLLEAIVDALVALLQTQTGRQSAPFADAQNARVEVLDGTGTPELYLDYPIAALTRVVLGVDSQDPVETLDVADRTVLTWRAGDARLVRTDGRRFGCYGQAAVVHVTYDAQADLPPDAALAVQRVAATIFRQRGSEDARVERGGSFTVELLRAVADEPLWGLTVAAHTRRRF